jgi:hypothetical protein
MVYFVADMVSLTASAVEGSNQAAHDDERAELARVLDSECFKRSPKVSRLLGYLCDRHFQGQGSEIKEYTIAVDLLGRDARFDPQQDAIVRVEIYHLRKRLKQYYASEGGNGHLQIVLPTGQYDPEFVRCAMAIEDTEKGPDSATAAVAVRLWRRGPIMALAAAVTCACVLMLAHGTNLAHPASASIAGSGAGARLAAIAGDDPAIRILAGEREGTYVDKAGQVWLADRYFHGGTTFHRGPVPIRRTEDPEIYRTGREGQFTYDVPLAPGTYELHLYFAETGRAGEALRGIGIAINGTPASTLDVASDAGEIDTATMKIYKDISPARDGMLHVTFQSSDPSFLNALEILPGTPGKIRPIRITTRDAAYRDHAGRMWMPDRYFVGGRPSTRIVPLGETMDRDLYQTQRFGHFTYSVPVAAPGRYTVTLHFVENWFGQLNVGGTGSRVFDVYCNGNTLLKSFDILKETGGRSGPLLKVFRNVIASPQGKLDLSFVPIVNFATISAIEVTEE